MSWEYARKARKDRRGGHVNKVTKEQREEIISRYLENPLQGTALAMSLGLTSAYAYKLCHERGLLPITRYPVASGANL